MKSCLLAASLVIAVPLGAEAGQPYAPAAFAAAQDAGKSILVDVSAPWCPVCAKQKRVVEGLESTKPALVVFDVDFDSAKDALNRFGVSYQSTLIVFKGKAEIARSTGETDPAAIEALVGKAL